MKKVKQLFLFLIPTLIVAVVFVVVSEENFYLSDATDSDALIAKVENPDKFLNYSFLPIIVLNANNYTPILVALGVVFAFTFKPVNSDIFLSIKNRSPPFIFSV